MTESSRQPATPRMDESSWISITASNSTPNDALHTSEMIMTASQDASSFVAQLQPPPPLDKKTQKLLQSAQHAASSYSSSTCASSASSCGSSQAGSISPANETASTNTSAHTHAHANTNATAKSTGKTCNSSSQHTNSGAASAHTHAQSESRSHPPMTMIDFSSRPDVNFDFAQLYNQQCAPYNKSHTHAQSDVTAATNKSASPYHHRHEGEGDAPSWQVVRLLPSLILSHTCTFFLGAISMYIICKKFVKLKAAANSATPY